ncbi:MAG: aquaporin family protein [Marinisporobacter sp.]|jgi:glycerol uptake facilitator protein|nr:aquaporin family protein [Marinisporobacter sp.]
MSAFMGEVIGTMILVLLGCGVCAGVTLAKSKSKDSGWIVVTVGWGIAVAMGGYAVGSISGAHLNPALTIALACIGKFPWSAVGGYIVAQMIGAIIGATLVWLAYLAHWGETENKAAKLGVFSTAPAIKNTPANLITEIIGTFVLVLGGLCIGSNQLAPGLSSLLWGILVLAIGLSLGGPTGYAINPARDLGPRIAHAILPIAGKGDSDWQYAWIPVVGPIIGGVLGGFFFITFFGA